MFNNIFQQINDIFPVLSIYEIEGELIIEYNGKPSQEQLANITDIISVWPVTKLRIQKIKHIEENWKTKLSSGWTTSYGWKLGIDVSDVALLNGAFTLAKEAANLGLTDPVSIVDMDGFSHELNLTDLTSLMLSYGQARSQLSGVYASKLNSIKNAESVEELESLDLTL